MPALSGETGIEQTGEGLGGGQSRGHPCRESGMEGPG